MWMEELMNTDVMFSSKSDHWSTPIDFYKKLDAEFKFTCDPCPLNSDFDGLQIAWLGRVFCNPPYSNIKGFIEKGRQEIANGNAELVVFLVPARTDTKWFHNHCLHRAEIRFVVGRLKFGGGEELCAVPLNGCGV
jgi:hypothetical protein